MGQAKEIWGAVTGGIGSAVGDVGTGITEAVDAATGAFDWLDKYKWWLLGGAALVGGFVVYRMVVPQRVIVERGIEGFGSSLRRNR